MERRKGTRKQVHNTTLHSVNCTKLFTAAGILPRRDNPTGRARDRAFPRGQRSKTRKYVRCNVAPCSPTSPTSPRARPSGRLGGERGPPFPAQQLRGQPGWPNPSVARTPPHQKNRDHCNFLIKFGRIGRLIFQFFVKKSPQI